jgi:hypothetical protein
MGRVAQTPLAAVGLLTPAPRSAATTAHRLLRRAERLIGAPEPMSIEAVLTAPNGGSNAHRLAADCHRS